MKSIANTKKEKSLLFQDHNIDDPNRRFICAKGVSKTFYVGETPVHALRHLELEIKKGEFLCIWGPSGSGKSTLLYILGCLMSPTQGELSYGSARVSQFKGRELAEFRSTHLGFIFQSFFLLNYMSALKNVELPLIYQGISNKNRKKAAEEVLDRVGLQSRLHHKPTQLSGGEQQRVAIARALVGNPQVVFADEITGNLDSKTGQDIIRILRELKEEKGITLVMVTHDEKIARFADRRIDLQDGRISDDTKNCL